MSQTEPKPRRLKRLPPFVLMVLVFCVGSLICAMLLAPSLPNLMSKAQVQTNAARYDEVIRWLQADPISSASLQHGDSVPLPPAYQDLSPAGDGRVVIYRNGTRMRVLFYLSSNSLFTSPVYMYASDDVAPDDFQGECSDVARERPNWYLFHCP